MYVLSKAQNVKKKETLNWLTSGFLTKNLRKNLVSLLCRIKSIKTDQRHQTTASTNWKKKELQNLQTMQ